jgi:two-component system chemotaxis sensor kinase CheA
VVVDTGAGVLLLLGRRIGSIGSAIVRPLPRLAVAAPWVGGAMLGPDGVPRIVLAPHALDRAPRGSRAGRTADPTLPILIVDDSLTTRMLEQSILESAGYEVDLAVSAEEALHKMGRTSYALLLVDVEMPGMDGFTLLETIRSDPSIPDVPCILVTSRESAADRARGEEVGARHYVVKGEFDQETLMRRIQELVR